jgi:hypothetical protein
VTTTGGFCSQPSNSETPTVAITVRRRTSGSSSGKGVNDPVGIARR